MSELDNFRQTQSMAQQIANKTGYQELVQYIGDEYTSKKLARLNVLIRLGVVKEDDELDLILATLIEENKAYFVTNRATEITLLGLILGDTRRKISAIKKHE